jgi:hypothetical protein
MPVSYQVVYWRDIPAQVKARAGRERAGCQLTDRFQAAIDQAAMRASLTGTDDYLSQWRTAPAVEREGPLAAVVAAVAAELEAAYPDARLQALAEQGGLA